MDRIFDTPWYSLEQMVYEPLGRSRDVGVCFDVVRAETLVLEMTQAMATAAREIQRVLPSIEVETRQREEGLQEGRAVPQGQKGPAEPEFLGAARGTRRGAGLAGAPAAYRHGAAKNG